MSTKPSSLRGHSPFLVAAVLLIGVLLLIYPHYQYYIDPDATSYLTLAKRYAAGDYAKAINGYWSPWSVWLTAILIRGGLAPFKAAIIINAAGAIGFLYITHSLMLLFGLRKDARWILTSALIIFLSYAVFWQSFDDLWECFFLLVVLRLLLKEAFLTHPLLWITVGFFGALAYFAKAYALPFFILQILCCTFLIARLSASANKQQWLKASIVSIITMLLVSSPWFYVLHQKYGIWTTGTAGTLNMSWYLVGHPYWNESIHHLLPPVYADSPSYWEDPFIVNGATPHFWNSPKLFILQLVKLCFNLLKFLQSINELTAFFVIAIILAALRLTRNSPPAPRITPTPVIVRSDLRSDEAISRTTAPATSNLQSTPSACPAPTSTLHNPQLSTLCLSFLLFPVGYFLINFESRYLWYMLPLCIIIIAYALQSSPLFNQLTKTLQRLILIAFALTIIAFPILGLKNTYNGGRQDWTTAQALKQQHIIGTFTTNIPYGSKTQEIVRLSYFSGNPYYNQPLSCSKQDLLAEMRRYNVKYYFHFYDTQWTDFQLTDEHGTPFPEATTAPIPGLKVFIVTP